MGNRMIYKTEKGRIAVQNAYNNMLSRWPVAYEQHFINTCLGHTFVLQSGEKQNPPVILLHGSGSNSAMWMTTVKELCNTHCVYCIDIPGEPGKSAENQLTIASKAYTDWLDDILKGLALVSAAFVGISLGGHLSAAFAIRFPQKVSQLVLLNPSGFGKQRASFMLKVLPLMLLGKPGRFVIAYSLYGDVMPPKSAIHYTTSIARHFKPRLEKIPLFKSKEMSKLTMPVLCILGEKDVMLYAEQTERRLNTLLPNAEVKMIPDAGHALIHIAKDIAYFLNHSVQAK